MDASRPLSALTTLYRRAPATCATLFSLAVSYLMTVARQDYLLWRSLGPGGFLPSSFLGWLAHTLMRPLAMPTASASDPDYLPPDDTAFKGTLADLPKRKGKRPSTFGLVPHRQIEGEQDEALTADIVKYLESLSQRQDLTLALSSLEASSSPALFVSEDGAAAKKASLSRLYLSGLPGPRRTLDGRPIVEGSADKHEFCHVHHHDGSLHIVLSPQDARVAVKQGWAELHRLAGLLYRGHWFPPQFLPNMLMAPFGGPSAARWSYLAAIKGEQKQRMLPPTYLIVYAPRDKDEAEQVKRIIDASVAWATGR